MMKIEVFGTGCAKCEALEANVRAAADRLGVDYELCKVSNLNEMISRGVVITPALAIDGQVNISGKVAGEAELTAIMRDALSGQSEPER